MTEQSELLALADRVQTVIDRNDLVARDIKVLDKAIDAIRVHAQCTLTRNELAEAIHRGRFKDREPTPLGNDRLDREYAYRIADSVLAAQCAPQPPESAQGASHTPAPVVHQINGPFASPLSVASSQDANAVREASHAMVVAGARSIGNTIHDENHMVRARACWKAMWDARDGKDEPKPVNPALASSAPQPSEVAPSADDIIDRAKDIVALWESPRIQGMSRSERNATIESVRNSLIEAVHKHAAVAQSVEQPICNGKVAGSNPAGGTNTPSQGEQKPGGEPVAEYGCKRAGGFVDSSCTANCDCHVTQRLSAAPSPVADNAVLADREAIARIIDPKAFDDLESEKAWAKKNDKPDHWWAPLQKHCNDVLAKADAIRALKPEGK
jgi:hypothetical protein